MPKGFKEISQKLQEFTKLWRLKLKNLDFLGPNSRCVGKIINFIKSLKNIYKFINNYNCL